MTRRILHLAGALALTASILCAFFAAPAEAQNRVTYHPLSASGARTASSLHIDEKQTVTLTGNLHPLAQPANDQGAVAASTRLESMLLVLAPTARQEQELDALLDAQQDSTSPLYRQWLTPVEFGARFGVSASALLQIEQWLTGHGFTVDDVASSARLIRFSGTAAELADAFHTALHRYAVEGSIHMANAQDPEIPAALTPLITGIVSLHDFRSGSMLASRQPVAGSSNGVHALYSAGSTHYLFPADFAAIYNVAPLAQAGLSGAGVSVAIAGRSNILLSDVAAFRSMAGLSAKQPRVILPGADPGLKGEDRDEATLDVEWAGAVAPAADVTLVAAPSSSTTDGIDIASAYIVNHALGSIVSVSYANCESAMGTAELSFYNALWKQAAAQGQTVLVASGDSGAAGCEAGAATRGTQAAVNGMCSSPYAVCVGGTQLDEQASASKYWAGSNSSGYGSALGYIPEVVWNEGASNGGVGLWATGGGASRIYAQPDWQAAVSGASQANGMRAVPDVALAAATHDGSMMVEDGTRYVVSGTSVSTPALAGILAYAVEKVGRGQGNINRRLYELAATMPAVFHPTQSGNNTVPGVPGYTAAGASYNMATGLGSVDAAALVNNWVAGPDFVLSASATSGSLAVGGSGVLTVQVAATGSASNSVTLSAAAPSGITVQFGSPTVLPGSSSSVTVTATEMALSGNQQISITGSNASGSQTVTYTLNVRATSACTVQGSGIRSYCGITAPVQIEAH